MDTPLTRYIVGITGASGAIYGVRLVQALLAAPDREVHLIVSPAGARVMADELPLPQSAHNPQFPIENTGETPALQSSTQFSALRTPRSALEQSAIRNPQSATQDAGETPALQSATQFSALRTPRSALEQSAINPLPRLGLSPGQSARLTLYDPDDIGAAPASGTFRTAATIICPCSMKTLGHVAAGLADSLLTRAADVALKEGRPLLVVPRETPLSLIHLRNLTRLAEAGAAIVPAMPAFYHHPQTIDDLVRHLVQKIMDRLGLETPGAVRWSGDQE